jgi:hypothetical protein
MRLSSPIRLRPGATHRECSGGRRELRVETSVYWTPEEGFISLDGFGTRCSTLCAAWRESTRRPHPSAPATLAGAERRAEHGGCPELARRTPTTDL